MKGQIKYEVTLEKKFVYPKSMLQRGDEIEDARYKAFNDFQVIMNEIVNNKFETPISNELFTAKVVENKGWQLRTPTEERNRVNIEDIISHFAILDLEKKYGLLDVEENPDIFEYSQITPTEGSWYLKYNIEDELTALKQTYRKRLRKFLAPPSPAEPRRATLRSRGDRDNAPGERSINNDGLGWRPSGNIQMYNTSSFILSDFDLSTLRSETLTVNVDPIVNPAEPAF